MTAKYFETHPEYPFYNSRLDSAMAKLPIGGEVSDELYEEVEAAKSEWQDFLCRAKTEGYVSRTDDLYDFDAINNSVRFGQDLSEGMALEQ